jgi:imidazolonepropionase-like amidohydrolase
MVDSGWEEPVAVLHSILHTGRNGATRRLAICLAVTLALAIRTPLHAQDATIIVAGRLLDPATGVISRDQRILVESGRISQVGARVRQPAGARVVDLSRYTLLPGLIDAHVHLVIGGTVPENALADLRAGFTTVVDLGARTQRVLQLADSINAGFIPGPRVLAAGIWVGTKGGVCEFSGIGIAGGPDAFALRVSENLDAGADVIKVCVSGWPAESYANPDSVELGGASLAAAVRRAHESNKLVIAHAISLGSVRAALEAGVNGLAHAAYLDSAAAAELKRRGGFVIPTLASLTGGDSSAAARALVEGVSLAYRAEVPIVFGTDGGVLPHGRNAAEFAALRAAGISPIDAIRAATTNAARAFRIADSVGAIAPGMSADVIAVEGDPLEDVGALTRVRFVMLRGRPMHLPAPVPASRPGRDSNVLKAESREKR